MWHPSMARRPVRRGRIPRGGFPGPDAVKADPFGGRCKILFDVRLFVELFDDSGLPARSR